MEAQEQEGEEGASSTAMLTPPGEVKSDEEEEVEYGHTTLGTSTGTERGDEVPLWQAAIATPLRVVSRWYPLYSSP